MPARGRSSTRWRSGWNLAGHSCSDTPVLAAGSCGSAAAWRHWCCWRAAAAAAGGALV